MVDTLMILTLEWLKQEHLEDSLNDMKSYPKKRVRRTQCWGHTVLFLMWISRALCAEP